METCEIFSFYVVIINVFTKTRPMGVMTLPFNSLINFMETVVGMSSSLQHLSVITVKALVFSYVLDSPSYMAG